MKAELYHSTLIDKLLSEITEQEMNQVELDMKIQVVSEFSEKYNLGLFDLIGNNVFDFKQFVFTFEEIIFALNHNLTFDQILEIQEKWMKECNEDKSDIESVKKFVIICRNYIKICENEKL